MCGDGLNTKIHKHNSQNGCKLCHTISTKDHFVSSSTHRVYEAVIPENISSLNCNSTNVIYLITCRKCKMQYVGETAQLLRDRIRHHNSCINHPEKDNTCKVLSEHFSKGFCKNATYTVNIIEKLQGTGRDEDGVIDSAITRDRRKIETDWMLKLRSVFPHGLNDRVGDEYMSEKDCCNINRKFPPLKRMNPKHRIRSKIFASSGIILKHFIYIVNESLKTNLRNTMNLIRVLLSSLKKSSCRLLYDSITDYLSEKHGSFLFSQYFTAALDILTSKFGTPPPIQPNSIKKPPSNRCNILFNNKAIDFINLQRILRNKDVVNSLPHHLRKDSPMVTCRLSNTIRSKLFNYKKFVQSIDVDSFLNNTTSFPCDCQNSPFINQDHQHVITGNLEIVSDIKLRNLISKGPNYREPVQFSCSKGREEILKGIDNCIRSWSNKEGLDVGAFLDWKNMITSRIDDRILELANNRRQHSFTESVFDNAEAKKCLSDLQAKYIMVPIDKASNNVAFICKRFYISVILQELGLLNTPSPTYSRIDNETSDNIIQRHRNELKDRFGIKIDDSMLTLPDIYWTPKLHKNPVKFRFIIASKQCTVKPLSKDISSIFSLFNKQIERYNKKAHYYSGIKSYWIIQNRDPVQETVLKSISRKSAKCVSSFDFSTLYTKIPHDKLLDVLQKIVDFVFKGGTRNRLAINKFGTAYWVTQKSSSNTFTKESIIDAVAYLINNCYFRFGNKLFRQDIGIPMGSDPAPFFANLFLYHYESSWLKGIKKTNNSVARKFGNVFRYIDDLLALNDGLSFESYYREIYPEELQLTKENITNDETNFLDFNIKINNRVFTTSLYDKRDHFGFNIARLPYRSSNIPCRMFYASISAECLRICRATSVAVQAIESIKVFLSRMESQGANRDKVKNYIRRTFNRHQISGKYNLTANDFVSAIFNDG